MTKKTNLTRALSLVIGGSLLLAASCSVDSSEFIFDDDEYDKAMGDGGAVNGDGDGDGDGDMGGDASTGGMGGDTGTGGTGNMPGDVRCNGKQVEFFAGGDLWAPLGSPCEFLCADGSCTGVCLPEASECVSGFEARTCDEQGAWQPSTCEFACVEDTCGGSCIPGARQCDGNQKQLCSEVGEWEDDGEVCTDECTDSDDGSSAACTGGCVSGDTQCLNIKQRQTCVASVWENDAEPCQFACLDGQCGGTCDPGTSICSGNAVQSCSSTGSPNPPVHCDGKACVAGACVGECQPGSTRCSGANIEVCNNLGAWRIEEKCDGTAGFSCFDYTSAPGKTVQVCGECQPNPDNSIVRCHTTAEGNAVEQCNFVEKVTRWEVEKVCEKGVCSRGTCFETSVDACAGQKKGTTHCRSPGEEYVCGVIPPGNTCERFNPCEFDSCGGRAVSEF